MALVGKDMDVNEHERLQHERHPTLYLDTK